MVFLLVSSFLSLLFSVFPGGCHAFCPGRLCWMYWVFLTCFHPFWSCVSLSPGRLLGLYWAFFGHVSFLGCSSRSLSWSPLSVCLLASLPVFFLFGSCPSVSFGYVSPLVVLFESFNILALFPIPCR